MNNEYIIRNEKPEDYRTVEELTRLAFWNVNVPGCSEHYLAHILREHSDFIPELDFVIEIGNRIIGNVMYTKAKLIDEGNNEKTILTFGPISILPEYQRKGYSKILLEHSFDVARKLHYDIIVIFGNPDNYVSRGFKSCKKYNICTAEGTYPAAMLVKELTEGTLDNKIMHYQESDVFRIDEAEVEKFDKEFIPMKKDFRPSQEEFYIHCRSQIL